MSANLRGFGFFFLDQLFWSVNFLQSTIDGERSEGVSVSGWMGGYVMRYINIEIFLGSCFIGTADNFRVML